jgi:hypothetical protein
MQNRYWESVEMFRKFVVTSLLINLIATGEPVQVAAGYLYLGNANVCEHHCTEIIKSDVYFPSCFV